jgi:hypothetical protein
MISQTVKFVVAFLAGFLPVFAAQWDPASGTAWLDSIIAGGAALATYHVPAPAWVSRWYHGFH